MCDIMMACVLSFLEPHNITISSRGSVSFSYYDILFGTRKCEKKTTEACDVRPPFK